MVMMAHYVAVLPSREKLEGLTHDWRSQVANFAACSFAQRCGPPDGLAKRPSRKLDWGTWAYEVSEGDLTDLLAPDAIAALPRLGAGERRIALWVECY